MRALRARLGTVLDILLELMGWFSGRRELGHTEAVVTLVVLALALILMGAGVIGWCI